MSSSPFLRITRQALRIIGAALLVVVLAGTPVLAASIWDIVNQVSQTQYTDYLNNSLYTHNGDNRGLTGAQHDLARANIQTAFASFGLATTLDSFSYNSSTYYNVVGLQTGTLHPNNYYIVGAHYDSVNNPGADDNASGVAGVLEAARVLSQYQFADSLLFIAFDREEQGLIGSTAYADAHAADNILGMVSLDMIAYNPAGATQDQALLYGTATPNSVMTALAAALSTYTEVTGSFGGVANYSDHAPFLAEGKAAALLIEAAVWSNPNYHQATDSVDTLGYIDYIYATDMTRGAVAWMAESADLVPVPGTIYLVAIPGAVLLWRCRARA